MTIDAPTPISRPSLTRRLAPLLALPLLVFAAPAQAQEDVTDTSVDAADVALTPLSDLNLARDPIPPILLWAQENPYANPGAADCEAIRVAIGDLDAVLGDDVDTETPEQRKLTAGGVAQSVVGMLIPFRGIIREISGANNHEYEFRQAIVAGLMRRAYLKGLGEERGCPYPARPMPAEMLADLSEDGQLGEPVSQDEEFVAADGTRFRSRPVVQSTD
ncbi:hypothetical protein OZN62_00845 [Aurantiacibacter sp. MUD11]|uniref:hypothetical protein n=1 Tax=Aurantiacibacter sp. MUD11 TaxID=3003265 RepID=UPI0022AA8C63|nr:hypothetical protein [Aurantiacibacter sp. MUD11]WAT18157.1 hypothetical protein OZN62_00845 [Aurantiacibacter sp. MUD11]